MSARRTVLVFVIATSVVAAATCAREPNTALARRTEARRLAAALLIGVSKSVDAGNRAVMADTDELSQTFAKEAEQASAGVERDAAALAKLLHDLGDAKESAMLAQVLAKFGEYRALERTILGLAVENTNLKAQRLSFGPATEAANALAAALESVAQGAKGSESWHVRALAVTAVAAVRQIQALQAPHIAEPDDQAMTRMEQQMASAEAQARSSLDALTALPGVTAAESLQSAKGAFDRFMNANAQIVALSRRNTNVRSLALALGQKRTLAAGVEDALHALETAIASHEFTGTR